MLNQYPIVGFVLTKDAVRARAFYEGSLGLEFVTEDPYGVSFRAQDNLIRVAKVPHFTPVAYTVLGWAVTGIEAVVDEMAAKGVVFERYPGMSLDKRGIWNTPDGSRVAWFKDPDGNVLSVSEHPEPARA